MADADPTATDTLAAAELPLAFRDKLPIVMLDTDLPLAKILRGVDIENFYYAQNYDASFSHFKAGPVGATVQHLTVQYGILGLLQTSKSEMAAVIEACRDKCLAKCGSLNAGLTIKGAERWSRPRGAEKEPDYSCVVLHVDVAPDSFVSLMRSEIRHYFAVYDQYATNPKVHITVAYLFDPRDAGQQTPVHTIKLADSLVDQLNDQFKGKAVDVSGMSFDDNGFQYYGMIRP